MLSLDLGKEWESESAAFRKGNAAAAFDFGPLCALWKGVGTGVIGELELAKRERVERDSERSGDV